MNSKRLSMRLPVLVAVSVFVAPALSADTASDLSVTGFLSATGNLDIRGNTASFGTEGVDAGFLLNYDSGTDVIGFNATSQAATWTWRQGPITSYQQQMELTSAGKLKLFRSGAAVGVEISPASANGATNDFIKLLSGGSAADTAQRIAGYSDVQNGYIDFKRFATSGPATGVVLGTGAGDVITIRSNGSSDTGKVGIGTNAPSAKLEVVGDLKISGTNGTLITPSITLPDGSSLTTARANTLYGSAGQSVASVDSSGKVNFANGITVGSGANLATLTASTTALGVIVSATGNGATAMGHGTTATGAGATAMGDGVLATGNGATSIGQAANAGANGAIAIGNGVLASAEGAMAIGLQSSATSAGAIAIGYSNSANNERAIAMGANTSATGIRATSMGSYTLANAHSVTVTGAYNVSQGSPWVWQAQDDLVVVGNGASDTARSNAFLIQKNGQARVAGTLHAKAGVRTPAMGDISMGTFTAGPTPTGYSNTQGADPAGLGAGLRYTGE